MDADLAQRFEQAIREDGRYPLDAFDFLHRGLEHATSRVYGDDPGEGPRHVSGQQLCEGLREKAIELWGPLARTVLSRWNIRRTRDFGEMVFLLVELNMIGRQESDAIEDFDDVYDFARAFDTYEIPLDGLDG